MKAEDKFSKAMRTNKNLMRGYVVIAVIFSVLGVFHYPFLLVALIAFIGMRIGTI